MKVVKVGMGILIVFLIFYILWLGEKVLLPLVIAASIAYLITVLTHAIGRFHLGGYRIPKPLAMLLAVSVIILSIGFVINLITVNIQSVIRAAPTYQANMEALIVKAYQFYGVEEAPSIREIMDQINFRAYLQNLGSAFQELVSRTGIIIVYLIFLLLEQRMFSTKIRCLVPDPVRQKDVFRLIEKIRSDIRTYIGIKVLTSAATALLSYAILRMVGVDFASFWAVLIFFLNFIPTIGSIIATAFPALLALVQFDTYTPFIIVITVLTALQFTIGSIIEPKLMGNSLNLSPIVILLSLGLWGSIWGIPGMFLCVPITVIIVIIFSYFPSTRSIAVLLSANGQLATSDPEKSSDFDKIWLSSDTQQTKS